MRQVPGVASAGMINSLPPSGSNQTQRAEIEGIAGPDPDAPAFAIRGIGPDYLQTLGIPVLSGDVGSGGRTWHSPRWRW